MDARLSGGSSDRQQPSVDEPSPLQPLLGYRVVELLAKGGSAEVFLAENEQTGERVALKRLYLEGVEGPRMQLERLGREFRAIVGIDHPNIVRGLQVGTHEGRPCLVMEFIEGGTLQECMTAGTPLDIERAKAIVGALADALQTIHDNGYVHRDVKPSNCLMRSPDDAMLADFGIVKDEADTQLTVTGKGLGTADYASPEQRYRLEVDHRADQYSLGVVAYEMLTGYLPRGQFKGPSELNARLHSRVDDVLNRALSHDPDDRYESVNQFADELRNALDCDTPRVRSKTPIYVGGTCVAVLGVCSVLLFNNWQSPSGAGEKEETGVSGLPSQFVLTPALPVNTTIEDDQVLDFHGQAIAIDRAGTVVVVWASENQDGDEDGVFARLFDASGTPVSDEIQVNTTTLEDQKYPSVAFLNNGDFVVSWSSRDQDEVGGMGVFAQRFDAKGNRIESEFQVNNTTADEQRYSNIAVNASGDMIFSWRSKNPHDETWGAFGRIFDSTGVPRGGEFAFAEPNGGDQRNPVVAVWDDGSFVTCWHERNIEKGIKDGIWAQRFDHLGEPIEGKFPVSKPNEAIVSSGYPRPAVGKDGNFAIVWQSKRENDANVVESRLFSRGGAPLTEPTQISDPIKDCYHPSIAPGPGNSWVVAYQVRESSDRDVVCKVYSADFDLAGSKTLVDERADGYQFDPSVAVSETTGEAVLVWEGQGTQDFQGVYLRRLKIPEVLPAD